MLAIDVSRSMCSIDVEPNRIAAAKSAVREFIDDQPKGTRIGLIAAMASTDRKIADPIAVPRPVVRPSTAARSWSLSVVGAAIIITMQNYLAQIGAWVTVVQGAIFVICVMAFRRGVVGEIAHWLKKPL